MELKDYFKLLRPYRWLVVGIPVILFAAGYLITERQSASFDGSMTFTVEKPQAVPESTSPYYQYDEYYAQLASERFAETIANWLKSPSTVVEIYTEAGLASPSGSARQVAQTFRVGKQEETTVVVLTVHDPDRANVIKIAESSKTVITRKLEELRKSNNDPTFFVVAMTPAHVFEVKTNPWINAALGAISGTLASLVLAFALAYLFPKRA